MDSNQPTVQVVSDGGLGVRVEASESSPSNFKKPDLSPGGSFKFIQDNDTALAHLNLDLRSEYEQADHQVARDYKQRMHIANESGVPMTMRDMHTGSYLSLRQTSRSDLLHLGPGLSNYFKWLKFVMFMFFLLSLVHTPVLLFNAFGGTFFNDNPYPISITTLGNLYENNRSAVAEILSTAFDSVSLAANGTNAQVASTLSPTFFSENSTSVTSEASADELLSMLNSTAGDETIYQLRIPLFCDTVGSEYCEFTRSYLLWMYGLIDAGSMFIFWLGVLVVTRLIKREERAYKKGLLKVNDFTLEVRQLPKECKSDVLEQHFKKLLGCDVRDVQIVEATGDAIQMCVKRGKLLKKLARQDAIGQRLRKVLKNGSSSSDVGEGTDSFGMTKLSSAGSGAALEDDILPPSKTRKVTKLLQKTELRFKKLVSKIGHLDARAASNRAAEPLALLAYVTLTSRSKQQGCIKEYSKWWLWAQPKHLRLNETHAIAVNQAPPPSTLLWENTAYGSWERRWRSFVALLVLVLVLVITASISYVTDSHRAFNGITDLAIVAENVCENEYDGLNATLAIEKAVEYADEDWGIDCLCENELLTTSFLYRDNAKLFFDTSGACGDYLVQRSIELGIGFTVSFVVLIINAIISAIITISANFMKFPSIVYREATVAYLMFVILLINTAFIVLLVNTDLETLFGISIPFASLIGVGSFTDFDAYWYQKVGLEITFVAVLNIFAPHMWPLMISLYRLIRRRWFLSYPSQAELNSAYLGPEFLLSFRYAQVLMTVFFVLMYSSGMPVLYPMAFFALFVTYWMDKFFVTNICRTPPKYSVSLGAWANMTLEWAILLHLAVGVWMYSSPALFPESGADATASLINFVEQQTGVDFENLLERNITGALGNDEIGMLFDNVSSQLLSIGRRVSKNETIPMCGLFVIIALWKMLRMLNLFLPVMATMFRFTRRLLSVCCAQKFKQLENLLDGDEVEEEDINSDAEPNAATATPVSQSSRPSAVERKGSTDFNKAVNDGEVIGINSYSILANPKYAHAFQLAKQTDDTGKVFQSLSDALHLRGASSSMDDGVGGGARGKTGGGGMLWSRLQARMRNETPVDIETKPAAPFAKVIASLRKFKIKKEEKKKGSDAMLSSTDAQVENDAV